MELDVARWLPSPGIRPPEADRRLSWSGGKLAAAALPVGGAHAGRLAMPAPVNAHDHGYGVRTLDFGCPDDALEPWIAGLRLRPATDPYLEALVAFGRVALSGCAATVHCHNSLNVDLLQDEARSVIRAARTCGIRLALSCPVLDHSPFVYGWPDAAARTLAPEDAAWLAERAPAYAPVPRQIEAVEALAASLAGPMVDVQFGPIGPQWCSDGLLEAVAEASLRSGRRVHMHLLESPRQRGWLDRRFPGGVVRHLDAIGLLSPRLTVAHGVQLRPDECHLLAERGVRLVSNPSANLRLRSGVLPGHALEVMQFAIGLDGTGFDDAQDIWQEMRLFRLLHTGRGLAPALGPAEVFRAAAVTGAAVVGAPVADDVVVVDWRALTEDALFPDDDAAERLLARMSRLHVTDLVVAGRSVVADRRLVGFDFDEARRELAAQAVADRPRIAERRAEAARIAGLVRRHYAAGS